MPFADEERLFYSIFPYTYNYRFRPYPIVPTIEPEMAWQNQGDLAYAYLWEATDEVLILRGDDNGFSGMHFDSNIYAADRSTGEKLWQFDAGFASVDAVVSENKQEVTIFTRFNPAKEEFDVHLRHMRLADGEIIWEQKLPPEKDYYRMTGTKDVIVFYDRPGRERKGEIIVLDAASGKKLWEKTMEERFEILNEGASEPYIIVRQGHLIETFHPHTGELRWSLKSDIPQEDHIGMYRHLLPDPLLNPFHKSLTSKWVLSGNEGLLIDLETGEVELKYTLTQEERITIVDDRHWMIQRTLDNQNYWESESFETVLYDVKDEKEIWILPGRVSGGLIENGVMYSSWDGVPSAIKFEDGSVLWQMEYDESAPRPNLPSITLLFDDYLLARTGTDLIVMGKVDGTPLYRLSGVKYDFPELHGTNRVRTINRDEQNLYVGSNNGTFSKIKMEELSGRQ